MALPLPMVEPVPVEGLTIREAEQRIQITPTRRASCSRVRRILVSLIRRVTNGCWWREQLCPAG
jgi:hypothetical protein